MSMTRLPSLILFDFDRTIGYLYRDPEILTELKVRVVDVYAPAGTSEEVLQSLSQDGYHAWHRLHDWANQHLDPVPAHDLNVKAEQAVAAFEAQRVAETELIPGAAEALRRIARSVPVGIVSSNSTQAIELALSRAGVRDVVQYVGGRETDPFKPSNLKPDPFQLELALLRMARASDNSWYVGDDVIDVEAAHRSSLRSVAVVTGVHSETELRKSGADLVVSSLSQLADIVDVLREN